MEDDLVVSPEPSLKAFFMKHQRVHLNHRRCCWYSWANQGRTSENPSLTKSPVTGGPPPPAPFNSAATGSFSHIRVIPKPPVKETPEQRMQRTNPFTFKKPSFSDEAQATFSSRSKPYNQQANLISTSDGSSFAQVRVFRLQKLHSISNLPSRCGFEEVSGQKVQGLDTDEETEG